MKLHIKIRDNRGHTEITHDEMANISQQHTHTNTMSEIRSPYEKTTTTITQQGPNRMKGNKSNYLLFDVYANVSAYRSICCKDRQTSS